MMKALPVQFLDQGLHRALFDAMPMPVFVVDRDVSLLEYNAAAAKLLGSNKRAVLKRKNGEVLHCIHSAEVPEGCGHSSACPDCVVRKSVRAASGGKSVVREWANMELVTGGKVSNIKVRVSTRPLTYQGQRMILLVLEGLND